MAQVAISYEEELWKDVLPGGTKLITDVLQSAIDYVGLAAEQHIEVSVLLTNNDAIQELNRDYRNKDKPTNVLSFPSLDMDPENLADSIPALEAGQPLLLGDIIVALETVQEEAQFQGKAFGDHFIHLLVHGLLHLLGHDHQVDKEADRMEAIEISLLTALGIADPYADGLVMDD